jgi:hypothetical protein
VNDVIVWPKLLVITTVAVEAMLAAGMVTVKAPVALVVAVTTVAPLYVSV